MAFDDLRELLLRLEEMGELCHVSAEVDWKEELGAVTRRGQDLRLPALLFERIKGYPTGYRVLSNLLGPTKPVVQGRLAIAIGFPKETQPQQLVGEVRKRFKRSIPPRLVGTGPCKQNIRRGAQVNLLEFPVPLLHSYDGGRYLGTWSITVTKDPDTGLVNWGTYRHAVHDERTLGWLAAPGQHGPDHYFKYQAKGEPMPMAIVIGAEPASHLVAASPLPVDVSEADVAGGLRGEPVELVKCETVDLEVPATAEIVIEGEVLPGERIEEGPFGEWTGYYAGERAPRPVFRAKCVTFRDAPILTAEAPGKVWDTTDVVWSVTYSALLANELEARGIDFSAVFAPAPASLGVVVSTDHPRQGYAHTIASAFWSTRWGMTRPYVLVVDSDVDVTSADEVLWCLLSRMNPASGIHVSTDTMVSSFVPFLSPSEKRARVSAKAYFDATFPRDWGAENTPRIVDFEHGWSTDVQRRVLGRWNEYGIGQGG